MAEFHFLRPAWFLALLPLAGLLWWALRGRGRGGAWARVCDPALLPFVVEHGEGGRQGHAGGLLALAAALAVTAAAGPTWERLPVPVFRGEAALVVALDLSASMDAEDLKPSRLARARFKVADLLALRRTGQTALLVFAGQAFVVTPLTSDTATIASQLQALETAIMPVQGSNPAAALELAGKLLAQAGMPRGHVLLVTDGGDADALTRAREVAAGADYSVSVLGVGSADGAPIPDTNGGFVKDAGGGVVLARLDRDALAALASDGGGDYVEAGVDDGDVQALARSFDADREAKVRELDQLAASQWHEVGPWLLLPLLPLAALGFRRGVLAVALAVGLTLGGPTPARADWWRTPDQAGQAAFEAREYADAARRFEDPAWRAAARYRAGDYAAAAKDLEGREGADDFYNRGNALAREGQLKEALAAYDEALKRAPADVDARHNREQVLKLLEQNEQGGKDSSQQQPGKQDPRRKPSQSERGEQQFGGDKGGQSDQDTSGATNAGGGAESRERQHDEDQSSDSGRGKGKARERVGKPQGGRQEEGDEREQAAAEERSDESAAERAQATEQWLQQIPDDPSGLLRRKFEYQYKQMYGDAPRGETPW